MIHQYTCLQRLRNNNKCWGKLRKMSDDDEFADFRCPRCEVFYTLEFLEDERKLREANDDGDGEE